MLARKLTDADGTRRQSNLLQQNPVVRYLQNFSRRFDLHDSIFLNKSRCRDSSTDRRDISVMNDLPALCVYRGGQTAMCNTYASLQGKDRADCQRKCDRLQEVSERKILV
jgi:hypothetical protein